MKSYRFMVSFVAATWIVASALTVSSAGLASAAEGSVAATDISAKASSTERRHGPSRAALSRYVRHISPAPRYLDCGSWCGRHFVLIIGVGY
jgi:hypothetical protein